MLRTARLYGGRPGCQRGRPHRGDVSVGGAQRAPLSAFADAVARSERDRLVSVGRYSFRGVERPQELFTLDPLWTV